MSKISKQEFCRAFEWCSEVNARLAYSNIQMLSDAEAELLWNLYNAGEDPQNTCKALRSFRLERQSVST